MKLDEITDFFTMAETFQPAVKRIVALVKAYASELPAEEFIDWVVDLDTRMFNRYMTC